MTRPAPVVTRPYISGDAAALRRLLDGYVATWYPPGQTWGEADRHLLATAPAGHLPPDGQTLLAWRGGTAVGCLLLRRDTVRAQVGELRKLYVVRDARRAGAGSSLISRMVAEAMMLGLVELELLVADSRPAAVAAYRSAGFHPAGDQAGPDGYTRMVHHL